MTKEELIKKIEAFCFSHNVEVEIDGPYRFSEDNYLYRLSESSLILLWIKLQCCNVMQVDAGGKDGMAHK